MSEKIMRRNMNNYTANKNYCNGKVVLNVYDLSKEKGLGLWHTGVAVHGTEYYFTSGGLAECEPGQHNSGAFYEEIEMGYTSMFSSEVLQCIKELNIQYNCAFYNPLSNNCNDFARSLCEKLCGSENFPGYVANKQILAKALHYTTEILSIFMPSLRRLKLSFRGSVLGESAVAGYLGQHIAPVSGMKQTRYLDL